MAWIKMTWIKKKRKPIPLTCVEKRFVKRIIGPQLDLALSDQWILYKLDGTINAHCFEYGKITAPNLKTIALSIREKYEMANEI